MVAGFVAVYLFWGILPDRLVAGWGIANVVLVGFFLRQSLFVDVQRFRRISVGWLRHLSVFSGMIALCWLPVAIGALLYLEGPRQVAALTLLVVMATGASVVLGVIPLLVVVGSMIILGVPTLVAVFGGISFGLTYALCFLALSYTLVVFSMRYSAAIARDEKRARQRQRDMETLAQAHGDIKRMAETDAVTGLRNRRSFLSQLENIVAARRPAHGDNHACFLIDLDHFKHINDAFGHDAGDQQLAHVAKRLRGAVGGDGVVARLGGDEFAVVTRRPMETDALLALGARISQALVHKEDGDSAALRVGGSVGAALFPEHAQNVGEWLSLADHSLRNVKDTQRGSIQWFSKKDRDSILHELDLSVELQEAVHRCAISMRYQPQIDLTTGDVVGLEALASWTRADGSIVPPLQFFKAAEMAGIVLDLGDVILGQITADLQAWRDKGIRIPSISINVHAAQIYQMPRFIAGVERVAAVLGAPERVVLEVTEDCIVGRGTEDIPALLTHLADAGYRISLDDFGTGYASLTHIKTLPIDEIKIDKKFIRDICVCDQDRLIVEAVVQITRPRAVTIVAEGIEDDAQLSVLRALGTHVGQGYFLAEPLTADRVADYLIAPGGGQRQPDHRPFSSSRN